MVKSLELCQMLLYLIQQFKKVEPMRRMALTGAIALSTIDKPVCKTGRERNLLLPL